jgi:molybdenum cofactor cytidylyltransferase
MKIMQALRLNPHELIAFVGAGGKTSGMACLANELAAAGKSAICTTSTRISIDQLELFAKPVLYQEQYTPDAFSVEVSRLLKQEGRLFAALKVNPAIDRVHGLPPEIIDRFFQMPAVDYVLNEADGAKMHPFKAPAEHEPAVTPQTTMLIPVVGMNTIGLPLTDEYVHRSEIIARLAGAVPGEPITLETIARVMAHRDGGLRNCPPGARVCILLNKVETPQQLEQARSLACLLLKEKRIDRVLIGAVLQADPIQEVWSRVGLIILAAGESSRFGAPKQLAQTPGGKPMLTCVTETALASEAEPVIVVLGSRAETIRHVIHDLPAQVVLNSQWAEGQSSSIRAGLQALPPEISAVLIMLADQPMISPAIVNRIIARYRRTLSPVVFPVCNGRRGHPVLFDRCAFAELSTLKGDTGGKSVVQRYLPQAEQVDIDEVSITLDIDTIQDLSALLNE